MKDGLLLSCATIIFTLGFILWTELQESARLSKKLRETLIENDELETRLMKAYTELDKLKPQLKEE